MRVDCHSHSIYSFDAEYPVHEMLLAAQDRNIDVYLISDHCEINAWERDSLEKTLPGSVAAIAAEKKTAKLKLLTGIEIGQPLIDLERTSDVLSRFSFDMVIAAVHNSSAGIDFYDTDFIALTDDEIFHLMKGYYADLLKIARWNQFDTLAHITYPYRYLNAVRKKKKIDVFPESFDQDVERVFEMLIQNQKALELNSSSFMRGKEDYDLNVRYFRKYREMGGTLVTFGSDAHSPDRIGTGLEEGYALLKKIGFSDITYYEKRIPKKVKLL